MDTRTDVMDHRGLLRLFGQLEGRRFIGVMDGSDCVELVFDDPRNTGWNLITILRSTPNTGTGATFASAAS